MKDKLRHLSSLVNKNYAEMSEYQKKQDEIVSFRLREERERLRMSQEDVARAIGVNVRTVNRWENTGYTGTKGKRLAELGMDVGYIMSGQVMEDPTQYQMGLSEPEKTLLRNFRICGDSDRAVIERLADALAKDTFP